MTINTFSLTECCDGNTARLLNKAHRQLYDTVELNNRPSCRIDCQMPLNVEKYKRQQAAEFCEDLGKELNLLVTMSLLMEIKLKFTVEALTN